MSDEARARLGDLLEEWYGPDYSVLTYPNYDNALLGVGVRFNNLVAVYDQARCIDLLVERDGMDREEAVDFFESNTLGAWHGEGTPVFMVVTVDEQEEE